MAAIKLAYDVYLPNESALSQNLSPVILIHCLVENKKTWKNIAPQIARLTERKVYAIDCRNHGDSPWTKEYGGEILTSDLGSFLEQHQIPKAIIVGHSMGGVVAMLFALQEPNKVEKLIVEDSLARKTTHRLSNFVPLAMEIVKEGMENQPQGKGEDACYEYIYNVIQNLTPMLKISPKLLDMYDVALLPLTYNGNMFEVEFNFEAILEAVGNDKLTKELTGTFEGQALFMFGVESQFKVGQDQLIAKHFPNAIKVGFKNAGHFIHHEYPNDFIRKISNFINTSSNKSKL